MSPSLEDVLAAIASRWADLQKIPEDLHLLCPRISDDDIAVDYDMPNEDDEITAKEKQLRIEESKSRRETTYYLSLVLGMDVNAVEHIYQTWKERTESFLRKCDKCIIVWHSMRKSFLKVVSE
jgi:senataxin